MDNPISGLLVSGAGGVLIVSAAIAHWNGIWIMAGATLIAAGLLWSAETLQSQLPVTVSGDRNDNHDLPWWMG